MTGEDTFRHHRLTNPTQNYIFLEPLKNEVSKHEGHKIGSDLFFPFSFIIFFNPIQRNSTGMCLIFCMISCHRFKWIWHRIPHQTMNTETQITDASKITFKKPHSREPKMPTKRKLTGWEGKTELAWSRGRNSTRRRKAQRRAEGRRGALRRSLLTAMTSHADGRLRLTGKKSVKESPRHATSST